MVMEISTGMLHGARDVVVIISQRLLCSQLWSRKRAARLTERAIVVHCNVKIDWKDWSEGETEKRGGRLTKPKARERQAGCIHAYRTSVRLDACRVYGKEQQDIHPWRKKRLSKVYAT